ncbi:MAG: heavy metal-binding domain-containing protein [Desulfuromonadales bacterium]
MLYKNGWFKNDGGGHSKREQKVQLWTCSMHPFIIKDKPGACPICGMELIKKIEGAADGGGPQTAEQMQQAELTR